MTNTDIAKQGTTYEPLYQGTKLKDLPDIEAVSAEVHAAWMDSKRTQGVTTRKAEDGEELMVPYEQLTERSKELDRGTVRAVYSAIRRLYAVWLADGAPNPPLRHDLEETIRNMGTVGPNV